MAEDRNSSPGAKFDALAQKYGLWLLIPLVATAIIAIWDLKVAVSFLSFFVFLWIFGATIAGLIWIVGKLIPKKIPDDVRCRINEALGGTAFLGGCAGIGSVLRGESAISRTVSEKNLTA